MFDTMTFTKALGAICGSLLVFLLLGQSGSIQRDGNELTVGLASHDEAAQHHNRDPA